ncbi:hypothetical protein BH10PSE12_BH10PSE12_11840 [soil metagenome]
MSGASSDGEVNHWPAFVDVLTTVIMVVTFLLVIMSAAVMVLSQRTMEHFKAQIEAKSKPDAADSQHSKSGKVGGAQGQQDNAISSPKDAETGTSVAEQGSILKTETIVDGSDRLTIRTRETPDTMKLRVKAMEDVQDSKGVEVKTADVLLRVDFEPMAVRYDPDSSKQVLDFLDSRKSPGTKYEIWSFAPQTSSISEAQRLAFYRAAMTRNLLIKAGIDPADISTQVRVTDASAKDGHNVRVVLKP